MRAILPCLLLACTTTKSAREVIELPYATGTFVFACDASETYKNDFDGKKDRRELVSSNVDCDMAQKTAKGKQTLLEGGWIVPVFFDEARHVFWVAHDRTVVGITTHGGEDAPGQRRSPPAGVTYRGATRRHVLGNSTVVIVAGPTFQIWDVARARAVEVATELPPTGRSEVGSRAIGYCALVDGQLQWATIDIGASLADGAGKIERGVEPAGGDPASCAAHFAR
jgi:hypothetical protein